MEMYPGAGYYQLVVHSGTVPTTPLRFISIRIGVRRDGLVCTVRNGQNLVNTSIHFHHVCNGC